MKIKSILNNSALIAFNENEEEVVLIGKGISFQRHAGDSVDTSKIEKVFEASNSNTSDLLELLRTVPEKYFEMTNANIRYVQKKMKKTLNSGFYISLLDHINNSIERYNKGIVLDFAMLSEVRLMYPKELEIAEWALDYINATLDIEIPEDEAGFISIHIIANSQDYDSLAFPKKVLKVTKEICDVVYDYYGNSFDKTGINYSRFITHLKYLSFRYLKHEQIKEKTGNVFTLNKKAIDATRNVVENIDKKLLDKYGQSLSNYEKQYLTIHICRLMDIQ